ncbi:hypothetical protein U14_02438 [Candidatus Moduliflexus flocculans]|uniref:Uncharacterized protein n=1 Tax=Candidatus Moduliflexus flocculans TaxID=1499966 RepID=A0A081BLC9_9BACT|nr:hypothetical protein U14_02438 [Candidatus Moduliflexus flocculans]
MLEASKSVQIAKEQNTASALKGIETNIILFNKLYMLNKTQRQP